MASPKPTQAVQSTKKYNMFKFLGGNRQVNEQHVKQLQKLMLQNG